MRPTKEKRKNKSRSIRVLIIDDHEVVRDALASFLGNPSDIEMVGEAGNGRDGIELAKELVPDVIVTDINMPDIDGIEATRTICSLLPDVRVIGFSMDGGKPMVDAMLAAGASDHIRKGENIKELLAVIRKGSLSRTPIREQTP